jgi:hypothetical protein
MFPKLQHDERWLADYRHFQQQISEMKDVNLQKELTEMLLNLKTQIEYVDQHHEQIFMTGRMPTDTNELRDAISKYRRILEDGITAYKNSNR